MQLILNVITQVRKLKTAQQLSLKTEIEELTIGKLTAEQIQLLEQETKLIQGVCKVIKINLNIDSVAHQIQEQDTKWYMSVQID